MRKCDVWAVATAYLLDNITAHYKEITEFVLESKITTLGEKGGTPSQTVGAILRDKKIGDINVFERDNVKGVYYLNNPDSIKEHEEVQYALERLKNTTNHKNR